MYIGHKTHSLHFLNSSNKNIQFIEKGQQVLTNYRIFASYNNIMQKIDLS